MSDSFNVSLLLHRLGAWVSDYNFIELDCYETCDTGMISFLLNNQVKDMVWWIASYKFTGVVILTENKFQELP